MAPILGYWKIRAYAQSIRLMLAYREVEYEEKNYPFGPPPDYDKLAWRNIKHTLGLPFPNLPYFIDGEVKMTQSIAIMRYLARKLDLDAETEEQRLRTDQIELQGLDLRSALTNVTYNKDFEKLKGDYVKNLPQLLKPFSDFLGKNKWFAGDKLTYVDFLMYEIFDQHMRLVPDCLKQFPPLEAFHRNFKELPTIKKYMASPKFLTAPVNSAIAYFDCARNPLK